MTNLSLAATNFLLQIPELLPLLGESSVVGPWIFDEAPARKVSSTGKSMIVVNEGNPYTEMELRKTALYPTLVVDIWSDSTRASDKSFAVSDSTEKIEEISRIVLKHLHFANPSVTTDDPDYYGIPRYPRVLGTAEEIETRTGVTVLDSLCDDGGVIISPVENAEGSERGRLTFNMTTY